MTADSIKHFYTRQSTDCFNVVRLKLGGQRTSKAYFRMALYGYFRNGIIMPLRKSKGNGYRCLYYSW